MVCLANFGYFIPQLFDTFCYRLRHTSNWVTSNSPTGLNLVRFCPSPEARLSIPQKTCGLSMRVRSAISPLASVSCSCNAALSSDKIVISSSESFAATALEHNSRIRFSKPEGMTRRVCHEVNDRPIQRFG